MFKTPKVFFAGACALCLGAFAAQAGTFAPDVIGGSGLVVQAAPIATPFTASNQNNLAAPKVVNGQLNFIDQRGRVIVPTADGYQTLLDLTDPSQVPAGFTAEGRTVLLDIAQAPGGDVFVSAITDTLPDDAPAAALIPTTADYTTDPDYHVIYRYQRNPDGTLHSPTALASFQSGPNGASHVGGALLGLDSGDVLFATGDGLPFGFDGRAAPQDAASHLSKLLRIDGDTGQVEVLAKGVRNVQRLTWADPDRSVVAFADMGGVVAEEINVIPLADLLDSKEVENFGWGRNADGNAREGTFYVAPGAERLSGAPEGIGLAPLGEPGFIQPHAQWGREDLAFAAVSGPVASPIGLSSIDICSGISCRAS